MSDHPVRIVSSGWEKELASAAKTHGSRLRIVCPFIKHRAMKQLLDECSGPRQIQAITRFDLANFYDGVSDLAALDLLLKQGAAVRGVKDLHAKVYSFDASRVVVTSANLTIAALSRNHEFGFVSDDPDIVRQCEEYFESLWNQAGRDVTREQLEAWKLQVLDQQARKERSRVAVVLGDQGTKVGAALADAGFDAHLAPECRAFIKFFGKRGSRAQRSLTVEEEVATSGSHWACTYPESKRPRQVTDGSAMFMGRMVANPPDIVIYGRAVGLAHKEGRDSATEAEIEFRKWKADWPHYIRVHHAEFVAGTLENGVSMNELMDTLQANSFKSTQRNIGTGRNTDPRRAYRQQPAVRLSDEGFAWLNRRLEEAFARHGTLSRSVLVGLDWPSE